MRRANMTVILVAAMVSAACSRRPRTPLALCEDIQQKTKLVHSCDPPVFDDDPSKGVRWARMGLETEVGGAQANIGMYETDAAFDDSHLFNDCNSAACIAALRSTFKGSSTDLGGFLGEAHSRKLRARILFYSRQLPLRGVLGDIDHPPSAETRAAIQQVLDSYK